MGIHTLAERLENVKMYRLDIPQRSWTKMSQAVAIGAVGGALLLGILSIKRGRLKLEAPVGKSIFDMALTKIEGIEKS